MQPEYDERPALVVEEPGAIDSGPSSAGYQTGARRGARRVLVAAQHQTKAADPLKLSAHELMVLRCHSRYPAGLNDFEVAAHVGLLQTSAGKRRKALELAGLVVFTETRSPSGNGGTAGVYRITPAGLAAVVDHRDVS